MKKLPVLLLLTSVVAEVLLFGCHKDNDPESLLSRMYDRPMRERSLKSLNEMFNTTMRENGNSVNNPKVKELINILVPGLLEAFNDFTRDKLNRIEIVKLLAPMKDNRAIDTFMQGLKLEDTIDPSMFEASADALKRLNYEAALPNLLAAQDVITAARSRRMGAPFTKSENEIEQSVISASVGIILGNPNSSQKGRIVKLLCTIAETSDELQDLAHNMKALKALGQIGDPAAIPTLIKGIAMKGKRRPIPLGEVAVAALQQIHNRDAVAEAVIAFAKGEDQSFNEYYKEEKKEDKLLANPVWYLQEGTNFLRQFVYNSPDVIKFLTEELNHFEPDEKDQASAQVNPDIDPAGWAMNRRSWAALALGNVGYKPLIGVIKERLTAKDAKDMKIEEKIGYIQALGTLVYPAESCDLILEAAKSEDETLRDKAFYNASLMCGGEFEKIMVKRKKDINCDKIIKERLPEGTEEEIQKAQKDCDTIIKILETHIALIAQGKKCGNNLECNLKAIEDYTDPAVERAIYTLYRLARDGGPKDQIVDALIKRLENPSMAAMQANVFALDHLTFKDTEKVILRIQEVSKNLARQSSYKDRARLLDSLVGRIRNRK